jgi:hypothetical protein
MCEPTVATTVDPSHSASDSTQNILLSESSLLSNLTPIPFLSPIALHGIVSFGLFPFFLSFVFVKLLMRSVPSHGSGGKLR